MEISINSNFKQAGTTVTVDGKPIKKEITGISFSFYPGPCNPVPEGYAPPPVTQYQTYLRVTTKEVGDDGVERYLEYCYRGDDDGEVEDSIKNITPSRTELADFVSSLLAPKKKI